MLWLGRHFGRFLFIEQHSCIAKGLSGGVWTLKGVIHSILRYPRTALGLLLGAGFPFFLFLLWEAGKRAGH